MTKKIIFTALLSFGFLLSACSPEASQEYLKPNPPDDKVEQGGEEEFNPLVDILFVVDDSGSMGNHQSNLSRNISLFTSAFVSGSSLDYNIGVTSTSPGSGMGALRGQPVFVSKNTPNSDQALQRNLMLGIAGSGTEMSFAPILAAFSPPHSLGTNHGFLRAKSTLAVIFITDAEDQSSVSAQDTYKFMLGLRGGVAEKILAYGVIIPTGVTGCARDGGNPTRIENFLSLFRNSPNNVMNLCAPDYGQKLAAMAKDIVKFVGRTIYLKRAPDLSSVRITFGNLVLPMDDKVGWIYDIGQNAIILGEDIDWGSQPIGSKVRVFYNAAKYDEETP